MSVTRQARSRRVATRRLLLVVLLVGVSCEQAVSPEEERGSELGSLQIVLRVEGNADDPRGFIVSYPGALHRLNSGDTLVVPDLRAGQLFVRFATEATHCAVATDTVSVRVEPRDTVALFLRGECYGDVVFDEWHGPYDDQLYYMDLQGVRTRLGNLVGRHWSPVWSPDGSRVLFEYYDVIANDMDVYVAGLDGSVRALSGSTEVSEADGRWSPDGEWIVYTVRNAVSGLITYSDLRLMRSDGTEDQALLDGSRFDFSPVWSPDGAWIAFACWENVHAICLVRPDGTEIVRAPIAVHGPSHLAWSPDGSRIAFEDGLLGHQAIRVVRLDTWEVVDLLPGQTTFSVPHWSPDSRRLSVEATTGVYVVDADGGGAIAIAPPEFRWAGEWTPDGSRVTFSGGAPDVETNSPDGSSRRTVIRARNEFVPLGRVRFRPETVGSSALAPSTIGGVVVAPAKFPGFRAQGLAAVACRPFMTLDASGRKVISCVA